MNGVERVGEDVRNAVEGNGDGGDERDRRRGEVEVVV